MRQSKRVAVVALAMLLAACAEHSPKTEGPGERAIARAAGVRVPADAADGEIAAAELPAYFSAQQKALRKALAPAVDAGLMRVGEGRDGSPRAVLDTNVAFDAGSAQLRPQALVPLTALADTLQRDSASVLHVIAFDSADKRLAERRAQSVQTVLVADGAGVTRVRAESRDAGPGSHAHQIYFVFAPVLAGHAAQAWMPPAAE
jgi:outer membrane protein OmpA-like peptidoglycan-associated protein